MDARGRPATNRPRSGSARPVPRAGRRGFLPAAWAGLVRGPARLGAAAHRAAQRVVALKPRGAGALTSALLIALAAGYGTVRGGHVPTILDALRDARDGAANAVGFRIAAVSITGRRQLSEAEVLAGAGITERTSLLFLDVEAARARLEAVPWIAQATVRKLYPGHLRISIEERDAFALWQRNGKVSLIAADGTVLAAYGERPAPALPLVVGPGAATRARDFVALLDRYPAIREQLRAGVLVAERRWNLRLKNGLEVRLPETEIGQALDTLTALDRERKLVSRDVTAIDLRLPDRVTVRLSDEAAAAREQAEKDKKKKAKGGPA